MNFEELKNDYENLLDRDYKKDNGIFYTDIQLAEKMIDFLNIPKEASIIDPNCGVGTFIKVLNDKGYKNIYGCDIDENSVDKCKELTGCENVFCIDSIKNNGANTLKQINHDTFDYIVGNPPYVSQTKISDTDTDNEFKELMDKSSGNLFVAAIYRFFEIVKDDGIISVIVPKNILHVSSYKQIRQVLLKDKCILSITELGIHFKSVRGEQIVLTIKNSYEPNNEIKFYSYNKGNIEFLSNIPQDYYEDEIIVFTDNEEMKVYDKLKNSYKTLGNICNGKIKRGKGKEEDAVRGKQIMKFKLKEPLYAEHGNQIFIQNIFAAEAGITACYGGYLKAQETVTVIETENESMCRYLLGLLSSRVCNYYLIKFIFNNSRLTIHTDAKYLNRIPIVIDKDKIEQVAGLVIMLEREVYLSDEWYELNEILNDTVYEIYGLCDEKEYIEKEMRKISAKKWYKNSK